MGALLDQLYRHSPPFVQSLGITVYSVRQRITDYGAEFRRRFEESERIERYSREELRAYQDERLAELVRHCHANVPFYRRRMDGAKLRPDDIRTTADLAKLPILTADDIREQPDALIARTHAPRSLRVGYTSGSTGTPLRVLYDRNVCIMKNVADWRQKRLAGIELGDPLALFWGRILLPGEQSHPPFWRYNWALRHLYCSSYHVSGKNLGAYVDEMARFGIKAIEGYPSTLHTIARYVLQQGGRLPLKAAFASSETLFPNQRADMEQAFQCPVWDYYGMAERVIFATDCERHDGMHVNEDFGVTEILDRELQPVAPGQLGRIVATGLHNYGMPLLRYRSGDVTSIQDTPCACGRHFPRMGALTARAENVILTPDGRHLSFASLSLPFKQMTSIAEAQVIQETRDRLIINVVPRPNWSEAEAAYLRDQFDLRIGRQMDIEVREVQSIPRSRSGKFSFIVSKVQPDF
jgi:phenylacetate-CoA ligase